MKFTNKNFQDCRDLFQRFKGKPVWIAGSDPSLSGYPDNFFDDKVSITLHLSHIKFPKATFRYSSEGDRSIYLNQKDQDYINMPLIAAYPLYGISKKETEEILKNNKEVYFHRMLSYPPRGLRGDIDEKFTRFKINQTLKNKARIWGGHGSCLHTCFYMAILLGASEIHLIGCGHNVYEEDGQEHFAQVEKDHLKMRPSARPLSDPIEKYTLITQTKLFQNICNDLGIPFYWHSRYSTKMNEYISVTDEWLENQKKLAHRKFPLIKVLYRKLLKAPLHTIINRF